MMYNRLGKEIIEAPAILPFGSDGINVEQRISLRAADRVAASAGEDENACAKSRVIGIDGSREMHTANDSGALAGNDAVTHLRERGGAAQRDSHDDALTSIHCCASCCVTKPGI
jgi:hypothetical protein